MKWILIWGAVIFAIALTWGAVIFMASVSMGAPIAHHNC
jgi:hypothetical protein